jgi:dihydrofolate reductase
MLTTSMTVSADGYIADRDGRIDWSAPSDELFAFHLDRVRRLGGELLGRRLYETMLVWETDASLRSSPMAVEFADVWAALPKVVFSRAGVEVRGAARRAAASLADEIRAVQAATDRPIEIGGADLAGQAFALGLLDEIQLLRSPVVLGGGTPFFAAGGPMRRLELLEARVLGPGVVVEQYRVL